MKGVLEAIRARLGDAPRKYGFITRLRLRVRPPNEDVLEHPAAEAYHVHEMLLREGDVVWGALAQSNNLILKLGDDDQPAQAFYSLDPSFDRELKQLTAIARHVRALKGATSDDPQQRKVIAAVTQGLDHGGPWTVPASCTGGREVRVASFIVFRNHLPEGVLRMEWFPLLVHPDTPIVMIVPSLFWPDKLVELWLDPAGV